MKIVVALGGSALLGRGEPATFETQQYNVRRAARSLAALARAHTLVVTHGNGPQVGMLAMQAAGASTEPYPLDVLGAETEGMIGYLLEQELANELPGERVVTVLTRTVVRDDGAHPLRTKFIGALFPQEQADLLAKTRGWQFGKEGQGWRRVVHSPEPTEIVELAAIAQLSGSGFLVICAGGGGIPVHRTAAGRLEGSAGVVEKDLAASLLASQLGADCLMLLTDVPAVFDGWGTEKSRRIRAAHPEALSELSFPATTMGPKIEAARRFATHTGGPAIIGAVEDAAALLECQRGTRVSIDVGGICIE